METEDLKMKSDELIKGMADIAYYGLPIKPTINGEKSKPYEQCKRLAIKHCELMIKEIQEHVGMYLGNLNPRWLHYTELKKYIQSL